MRSYLGMAVPAWFWFILVVGAVAVPPVAGAKNRHRHRPPRAPQWLRPDRMAREVYAEPVNSAVRRWRISPKPTK